MRKNNQNIIDLYNYNLRQMLRWERRLVMEENKRIKRDLLRWLGGVYKWLNNLTDKQREVVGQAFETKMSKL